MKKTLLILCACICAANIFAEQPKTTRIEKCLSTYNDVMRQLDNYYVDTLNYEDLTETAINQMLRKIDPYTVYFPERKNDDLKLMTTGKYGGIGAVIMQRKDSTGTQWVYISDPYENMPAAEMDLRAGDKILSVDGKNMKGKNTQEVSNMLRGLPETELIVKIEREGQLKPITKALVRKEIKLPAVGYYTKIDGDLPVAYIYFTEFTEHSADEFRSALVDLVENHGCKALIFDLRGNGGGIIDEAVKIMSLFVPKGTEIVSTKGKDESKNRTYKTTTAPLYPELPITLLVNSSSASASEIVAGSMQDLDRATLIGTRTFGKGLVQNVRSISGNGHLKVTTAKYYIPSGRCIQAIDYSKRRADGSVERVPDSLTHEFKTRLGRIVRDGGGIEPDIKSVDTLSKVDISYSLYYDNLFFDYATRYRNTHDSLPPVEKFEVTDEIIDDFINFLREKNFKYETETSKYMGELIEMAEHEDIDTAHIASLKKLKEVLTPNMEEAIWRQKEHIREYLGSELVKRYYFQKGNMAYGLRYDDDVKLAIESFKK